MIYYLKLLEDWGHANINIYTEYFCGNEMRYKNKLKITQKPMVNNLVSP